MSHTCEGEHAQSVWLTDSELETLIEVLRFYLCADEHWPSPDEVTAVNLLLRRLDTEK